MKKAYVLAGLLLHSLVTTLLASADLAAQPAPFPVFLKSGFSSVLEFEETPSRIVLGDTDAFQVERLDHSLVLRALLPYATSNLFVYFKEAAPRLFILTAAEDAVPTYFKKIEGPKPVASTKTDHDFIPSKTRILSARFDAKKDYLTVEVKIAADAKAVVRPNWGLVRLRVQSAVQAPFKLWSERKEIQKDSSILARFIFSKPNVARDLSGAVLLIPLEGQTTPLSLALRGGM